MSKIGDAKTLQFLDSFKRYSTERVMKSLVGELTENDMRTVHVNPHHVKKSKELDDNNPKQLQKLAGYAIVNNSSGKHNGESHISYRGRKRLRYILYEAAISLVGKNVEFKEIHNYYLTRDKNPLKKMQSIIAVACKVIRIFYAILTKGIDYDGNKMLQDIVRPSVA